jgi:hypothetical protein
MAHIAAILAAGQRTTEILWAALRLSACCHTFVNRAFESH